MGAAETLKVTTDSRLSATTAEAIIIFAATALKARVEIQRLLLSKFASMALLLFYSLGKTMSLMVANAFYSRANLAPHGRMKTLLASLSPRTARS